MQPSITVPISQLPQGVVPTIAALRAISNATISDGAYVRVLGSGAANDGGQAEYIYSGASTLTDNASTVISAGTTGSWIRLNWSPVVTTYQTASYSGIGENFVLLSGAGNAQLQYTLPPSQTMFGQEIKLKCLSTGAFQVRATGSDSIFPSTGVTAVAFINLQNAVAPFGPNNVSFRPYSGVWYQV